MKLIKFQIQDIAVPDSWDRPYYRTLEHEGLRSMSIYDKSITTMPMVDYKTVDYEQVILREGKKEWKYFVNFEEAKLVMPILEGIVNNQTKTIKKENIDLKVNLAYTTDIVKHYEKLWFVKLYNWLIRNTQK